VLSLNFFEICFSLKYGDFLYSNDLQIGFKKVIGCADAIHVAQQVVEHFNIRGSTVFVSSLDASKAFDRVDHNTLFKKLLDRNMPLSKSWLTGMVNCMPLFGGIIRSVASHLLCAVCARTFTDCVDDLIIELELSGYGCSVGDTFFGCVIYADDLLLLSASVCGLQSMLDSCYKLSFGL